MVDNQWLMMINYDVTNLDVLIYVGTEQERRYQANHDVDTEGICWDTNDFAQPQLFVNRGVCTNRNTTLS